MTVCHIIDVENLKAMYVEITLPVSLIQFEYY